MTNDLDTRRRYLEALQRAEVLAAEIAKGACLGAASGRPVDMESARMALDTHRRARELREQAEAALAQLSGSP